MRLQLDGQLNVAAESDAQTEAIDLLRRARRHHAARGHVSTHRIPEGSVRRQPNMVVAQTLNGVLQRWAEDRLRFHGAAVDRAPHVLQLAEGGVAGIEECDVARFARVLGLEAQDLPLAVLLRFATVGADQVHEGISAERAACRHQQILGLAVRLAGIGAARHHDFRQVAERVGAEHLEELLNFGLRAARLGECHGDLWRRGELGHVDAHDEVHVGTGQVQ